MFKFCFRCFSIYTKHVNTYSAKTLVNGQRHVVSNKHFASISEMDMKSIEKEVKRIRMDPFERDFDVLTVDKYSELIKDDETKAAVTKILELYEHTKYTTGYVPVTIDVETMERLLDGSRHKQIKLINRLYVNECRQFRNEKKRELIAAKKAELHKEEYKPGIHFDPVTNEPLYGYARNSLVLVPHLSKLRSAHRNQYASLFFGQHVVFDFDYDNQMDDHCITNTCKQMVISFGLNRKYSYPFNIWFCNFTKGSKSEVKLNKSFPNLRQTSSFLRLEERSYLDVFQKEKLVYLTPNADRSLREYDHDAVYIIGAYNDSTKRAEKRASFEKARREGLKMAKLPIDDYLPMKSTKSLTMNQVLDVLNTVKITGDWRKALTHVPRRKIKSREQVELEQKYRQRTFSVKQLFGEENESC